MKQKLLAILLLVVMCTSMFSVALAEDYTIKVLTIWSDTNPSDVGPTFRRVVEDFCNTHEGYNFEYEFVQQFETASKLSVLIASNDVPDIFIYEPGSAMNEMIDNGVVVNLSQSMEQLGLDLNELYSESGLAVMHSVSDYPDLYYVCNGLAGEALWYNKTIFEENGLEVPETWEGLMALCDKLLELGIQPIALPNEAQWPMTRWIGLYSARLGGHDAHLRASTNDGIRFDDPIFVEAATKIQEMCQKGYFGKGFNALTQDDGYALFLNGKAAMLYQGTWGLNNFRSADVAAGQLSQDQIGHFNPGYIEGSVISPEEVSATAGVLTSMAICFGKDRFDQGTNHEFLKFFFENYGNYLVEDGFTSPFSPDYLTATYKEVDPMLEAYQDILATTKYSTLWFEAKMNTEVSSVALENAQLLGEGSMTPEQYCAELAAAVDARMVAE